MDLSTSLLEKTNIELKCALTHFIDSLPNYGPLANQVVSIKEALNSNEAIFTFTSLVEQYAKMQQSIDELEREDRERDINAFKVSLTESANKNLSTIQTEKISDILSEINIEQPHHVTLVAAGKALEYFTYDLDELRKSSDVIISNVKNTSEETDVVAIDVLLASKRLIKEVSIIAKQLSHTYPNDKFIHSVLQDASQFLRGKGTFFKPIALLERVIKYLALLIQQERCNAEEMLNDIQANLLSAFKQTAIIDKLMTSTINNADNVKLTLVTEFRNMEVTAKSLDTMEDMKTHINKSVLLVSEIMNDYVKTQKQIHQANTKTINNLNDSVGNASRFIEQLEHQLNTAQKNSLIDELTAVCNRKGYVQAINKERKIWLTSQRSLTLVLIDVDHFKSINDNFGHSIGDQVLKSLVQTIQSNIRLSDHIARYGGDEFVVILPGTVMTEAINIANKIRKVVNNLKFEIRKKNKTLKISCSFGISNFTDKRSNTVDVFNDADEALYQGKANGKDAIVALSDDKFIFIDK